MLCSPPSVRRVWVEIMSMMRWLLLWPMFPYAEGVGNDPVKQKKLTTNMSPSVWRVWVEIEICRPSRDVQRPPPARVAWIEIG